MLPLVNSNLFQSHTFTASIRDSPLAPPAEGATDAESGCHKFPIRIDGIQ